MEESRKRRPDHQGECGVCYSIDFGGDLNDKKKQNMNTLVLAGRKQEDAVEEIRERRHNHWGAWDVVSPFFGVNRVGSIG